MQYFLLFFLFGFNLKLKKEEISSNTSSLLKVFLNNISNVKISWQNTSCKEFWAYAQNL